MTTPDGSFPPLLNPNEPLAYLPPDIASALHVFAYVNVATNGMFVWELVLDLSDMGRMLSMSGLILPNCVYLASRIVTLSFLISTIFMSIIGGPNCGAIILWAGISWALTIAATTALFFLRVRAIYLNERKATALFFILWLCVLGGAITVPTSLGTEATHVIPTSQYCIPTSDHPAYAVLSFVMPVVFDSIVFFAISYRLYPSYPSNDGQGRANKSRVRSFIEGEGLPRLSKALLRGGQQYYLVALVLNVVSLALYVSPSVSQIYRIAFTSPVLAIINALACKVYRDTKLGRMPGQPATLGWSAPSTSGALSTFRATNPFARHCQPYTCTSAATTGPGTVPDGIELTLPISSRRSSVTKEISDRPRLAIDP